MRTAFSSPPILVLMLLSACSRPVALECGNPKTIEMLSSLIKGDVLAEVKARVQDPAVVDSVMSAWNLSLGSARTTKFDKELGRYECAASMTVSIDQSKLTDGGFPAGFTRAFVKTFFSEMGPGIDVQPGTRTVTYAAELTDDRRVTVVRLLGQKSIIRQG